MIVQYLSELQYNWQLNLISMLTNLIFLVPTSFFLEKNMLSFFLRIMKQKCGSFVCVQLLQTLNILFENIRNETSLCEAHILLMFGSIAIIIRFLKFSYLDYLLSNNHVNCIIVHKFDFSDEEVMAYYISFLKTMSLKLNVHTIHFFFNEVITESNNMFIQHEYSTWSRLTLFLIFQHTNDFPLYTEGIKFFNHSESMVRIAVRTLTLNVYKVPKCYRWIFVSILNAVSFLEVGDESMLAFIRDRTAAPYFSNLVWFIGNHIVELDNCVRADAELVFHAHIHFT